MSKQAKDLERIECVGFEPELPADDDYNPRVEYAHALKRAKRTPEFKEAVLTVCDAARSAAVHAIFEYTAEAKRRYIEQYGWDIALAYYFEWAVRDAAARKFLRTIHRRSPFSTCMQEGDAP